MATAPRSVAPTPNIAPLLGGAAVIAGLAATWLRLPGALVALLILTVAAWMSSPPPLTGRKDAAGYPTVGNPGEEHAFLRHRMWSHLKWRLLLPSREWLFNDIPALAQARQDAGSSTVQQAVTTLRWLLLPSTFVTVIAVGAAFTAFTFPVDQLDAWQVTSGTGLWLMWPNAIAAYVIVKQVDAARRRFAAPDDPRPAVTIDDLVAACAKRGRALFAVVVGAAAIMAVVATAVTVAINAFDLAWLIVPTPLAAAGVAISAAAMFLRAQSLPEAVEKWEQTVDARAQWILRWESLKIDPAPFLIAHTQLGNPDQVPVMADTFEAPASLGAIGAIALLPKLAPALGAGMRVSVLAEPDTDSQGQPIPGSKHPLRFTVVAWPVDTTVEVSDPSADTDMIRLLVRTAAAANTSGYPQPMLLDLQPVFTAAAQADDVEEDSDELDDELAEGSPAGTTTAAYITSWGAPDVDTGSLMPGVAGGAAGYMGTEAIADEGGVLYIGALTSGTTPFTDPTLAERFDVLARENAWRERWTNVLKMGEQQPYIQSGLYKQAALASGQALHSQPFMTPQGIQSELYITAEKERKLQSTLDNAPFVSVTGWVQTGGRAGERHPGAFRVVWSNRAVPLDPAQLVPSNAGATAEPTKWALAAAVNAGFDSARLARPQIVDVSALTSRQSKGHIWDLTLRLYGGVTLLAVKTAAEKIRQGMGAVEWLRITGHPEGVRLVAGASPQAAGVAFSRPSNRAITTALDWEQAFIDAKLVSPVDGSAPRLTEASTLATNDQVESLVFTIPRGLSITDFQEPKAVDRMRVNAKKVFVDVRHTADADAFRLLACEVDPMPLPAPFMWDAMGKEEPRATSFGTNVEGAPVTWQLDLDSHLLVLGSNGSGKGIAATSMLTDQLMTGWDVYAADPNKGFNDFAYADPWLKFRATTYPDTVGVVRKMVELLEERKQLNSRHGVSNIKDLPDDVRPPITCLFLDEFTSLVIPEVLVKLGDNPTEQDQREHAETTAINAAKAAIGGGIGRILREGRATGLVMVLMGQKLTANELKYVPGGSTIKSQMSRLAMGKMNFGDMMSAFNDAAGAMGILGPSVPRGRGIFESTSQAAFAVQTWWGGGSQSDHFQGMVEHISAVRAPLTDSQRFDPEPYRPAVIDDTPVFGRRIGDGDVDEVVDVSVVDLGEIDLGFDFDDDEFAFESGDDTTAGAESEPAPTPPDVPPEPADTDEAPADATHADHATVTFVGPGHTTDDHSDIDVDELPTGPTVTGSPAVDAILAWVTRHPGVRDVTWVSPLVDDVDDIGLTHGELAVDALRATGVSTVACTAPQVAETDHTTGSIDADAASATADTPMTIEQPVSEAPGPRSSAPQLATVDDDLFDSPTLTPVQVTDDLFD